MSILLLKLILTDLIDVPPPHGQMHHGIYIMECYLAAILDSSRKGGNFTFISDIHLRVVRQSASMVTVMSNVHSTRHPPHDN